VTVPQGTKGIRKMHSSTGFASSTTPLRNKAVGPRRSEDLMYQAITVAAMLSLLASVWIF
jgi:hypothetical protein